MSDNEFPMLFNKTRYDGYTSYSYLEAGVDYDDFTLVPELGRVPLYDIGLTEEQRERTIRLIDENIVISLHEHPNVRVENVGELLQLIRTGRYRTGYQGLSRSGMTALFDNLMNGISCVTSKWGWKWDDVIIDMGMRLSDIAHQDYVVVGYSVDDIVRAKENGQLALVLALESATPIENEVDRLDILYGFGVRQIGVTYSESNSLGSGLKEPRDGGLTALGRRAVERMNKLGIAVDVSHSSDQTCLDTFEASSKPVLITHAGARAIWPTPRMMPDEVLTGCAESGGVLGVEAAPHTTISRDHPVHTIDSVMDHFEYCVNLMGIDHVAFGPDTHYGDHVATHKAFAGHYGVHLAHKGPEYETVEYVKGLENPTENFFNIVGWLVKHGYSDEDIAKVTGGNVMRVLDEIW